MPQDGAEVQVLAACGAQEKIIPVGEHAFVHVLADKIESAPNDDPDKEYLLSVKNLCIEIADIQREESWTQSTQQGSFSALGNAVNIMLRLKHSTAWSPRNPGPGPMILSSEVVERCKAELGYILLSEESLRSLVVRS